MSDLIEKALYARCDHALTVAIRVAKRDKARIKRLQAVADAARHLLAGGDKEAVYHLEKALAALEDDDD